MEPFPDALDRRIAAAHNTFMEMKRFAKRKGLTPPRYPEDAPPLYPEQDTGYVGGAIVGAWKRFVNPKGSRRKKVARKKTTRKRAVKKRKDTVRIDSLDFTGGGSSMHCWAVVMGGLIMELHEDRWREGGMLWGRGGHSSNGTLRSCFLGLGRDFGAKWYSAVRKAAHKEKLPTAQFMLQDKKKRNIAWTKGEYDLAMKECSKAKKAYLKAQRA